MTRLVDDLMLLARSEQPGFVRLAPVDLADLVVEVAAKARPLSPRRWVIDELAETTVAADGQRLTQALLQLAANAVAHTQEDDVIGFGASVDDGLVNLWVRDSGTGIDPARHDQVFRRASRGEADRSSQGLGLGLAIVSSIAGAHGGSVRLDSAVGVGSRFTLELPAVAAAAAAPGGDR
jgi:signal transduction histidine kinase